MNPFDEIALEETIRIKEANNAEEIIAVSIDPEQSQETLRTALAMGADRAILIIATDDVNCDIEPLDVAKILNAIVVEEKIDLVLCGKQAIDNDMNATGQMLSALMGTSQATYASKIELNTNKATVTREVDGFTSNRSIFTAVISVDLRLNEPRYASLPNIMKAKENLWSKKLQKILIFKLKIGWRFLETKEPPERPSGIKVSSVDELIEKLKNEVGVI